MINSLTTLESHLFKITSHHFRITSFQLNVISRREKKHIYGGRKIKKIIEFHNEKQTKKLLLSNKTNKKKTKKKTYRKRAKAQKPTRFYG